MAGLGTGLGYLGLSEGVHFFHAEKQLGAAFFTGADGVQLFSLDPIMDGTSGDAEEARDFADGEKAGFEGGVVDSSHFIFSLFVCLLITLSVGDFIGGGFSVKENYEKN